MRVHFADVFPRAEFLSLVPVVFDTLSAAHCVNRLSARYGTSAFGTSLSAIEPADFSFARTESAVAVTPIGCSVRGRSRERESHLLPPE